ncbi:MAG TPA: PfkB family carbohydrate kinase [Devosia sp.]|nr:PfkB family carbohydrate kinase [Devosia sp.]
MTATVLCVGALSLDTIFRLDMLPASAGKYIPEDAIEIAQGMATAQAATIARLGGAARLWASCSDDATGDRIVAQLSEAGIDLSALRRVPSARSGFSTILMDRRGELIVVPHYDPAIRTRPDALPPMDDVAIVSVDVRWPDAAEMALRAARKRTIPAILDLERAPPEILDRLLPLATHILASEAGARQVTGLDPQPAAAVLAARFGVFAAVTAGAQGVYWPDDHLPAFPVEAIDTLAAGDVFHGAFALRLAEGATEFDAIRFASAAAAIKCTRFGGRLGAPARAEVEALLATR